MKHTLNRFLLSALLLGAAASVSAGDHKCEPGFHGKEPPFGRIEKKLDLSDEQKAQIAALRESMRSAEPGKEFRRGAHTMINLDPSAKDYDKQVKALAKNAADMAEQRVIKMAEYKQKMAEILTPEQRAKMRELVQKRLDRKPPPRD